MNNKLPKILIIAPHTASFVMLRMDLGRSILHEGYDVIVVAPKKGRYHESIIGSGMRHIDINLEKNSLNPLLALNYQKHLTRIIKSEKPDKILCYTSKPTIFGSVAAHQAGVKEIYSLICGIGSVYSRSSFKNRILQSVTGCLYRKAFKYNKKIIFQNQDDLTEFVERGYLAKEKCALVDGSGVDMQKFKYSPLPSKRSFIMVSRVIREKGVQEYFKAAKIIKEKYPDVTFTYIGDYDKSYAKDFEALKTYIHEGTVIYIPTSDDVAAYLTQSQVFVLPSYYREGVPRTLLEALSVGRPIITTDTPGCRETISDGKNGLFVKPRNTEDLAQKIEWMINHPQNLRAMAEASHILCQERFEVDKINKKMLSIMSIKDAN